MNSNKKIMIISGVLVLLAFFGGMKYGEYTKTSSLAGTFRSGNTAFVGGTRGTRGGMGGNAVFGQILSKDQNGITVKGQDGSSKIVLISSATVISKEATGTGEDLAVGKGVTVIGQTNTDGSITAQSIQLRPDNMMFSSTTRKS